MDGGGYVLVVDDDDDIRAVIALVLGERHAVRGVDSGQAALRVCAEAPPDVIVLDLLSRAELGGFETVERLRDLGCDSPVVVVSGASDGDLERAARLPGVTAVVPKPFEIDALTAAVERALAH